MERVNNISLTDGEREKLEEAILVLDEMAEICSKGISCMFDIVLDQTIHDKETLKPSVPKQIQLYD